MSPSKIAQRDTRGILGHRTASERAAAPRKAMLGGSVTDAEKQEAERALLDAGFPKPGVGLRVVALAFARDKAVRAAVKRFVEAA